MAVFLPKPDRTNSEERPLERPAVLPRLDWRNWLPLGAAAVLLAVLAWPVLRFWNYEYTKPESYYQHAPLIPMNQQPMQVNAYGQPIAPLATQAPPMQQQYQPQSWDQQVPNPQMQLVQQQMPPLQPAGSDASHLSPYDAGPTSAPMDLGPDYEHQRRSSEYQRRSSEHERRSSEHPRRSSYSGSHHSHHSHRSHRSKDRGRDKYERATLGDTLFGMWGSVLDLMPVSRR